jgi:RimJ/RimL family protein N-acetyltransferase
VHRGCLLSSKFRSGGRNWLGLAYKHWGKGYATEGALACLRYGFETLKLDEIVSFTAVENTIFFSL